MNQITNSNTHEISINPEQKNAIEHMNGPMMVLAGPGSGKTFVITRRILNMIKNGIAPENILVITFTKASASEMQQRFLNLLQEETDEDYSPVTFGTFHAIYYHILKTSFSYENYCIVAEKEKRDYLKMVLADNNVVNGERINDVADILLANISKVKNEGNMPKECNIPEFSVEEFKEIYYEYNKILNENKKIDFDDMVLNCRNLFLENSKILKEWQERYQYIMIDEFQDINQMQYDVIQMLSGTRHNLFIVGDDDQSIYGFRGSKPEIMLNFPKEYPECEVVNLTTNYRSAGAVVEVANGLIGYNKCRFKKCLKANQDMGNKVKLHEFNSKEEQATEIVRMMKKYLKEYKRKDIAIIIRTNAGAGFLLGKLTEEKIPYEFKEKPVNIFSKSYMQDVIAFLKFVFKAPKRNDFIRFMNKPTRYIKRDVLSSELINLNELIYNTNKKYLKENLFELKYHIQRCEKMDLPSAYKYFMKAMDYELYLKEKYKYNYNLNYSNNNGSNSEINEDLQILYQSLLLANGIDEWLNYIEDYENNLKKASENIEEDRITIITMHSSKGLEYPVVFIPDINEGNVPQGKAEKNEEIEEERRVFYVALTRAKKYLHLSYIKSTKENRLIKSRFLKQMKNMEFYSSSSSSSSINSSNS